jgi:hypothetical protein
MDRRITVAAGLLCLNVGMASAATITTPIVSAGPYTTDVADLPDDVVNLPLFNSNLGTLTAVSVSETGTFFGAALLENTAPEPESFSFHIAGSAGVNILSNNTSAAAADLAASVFNIALPTQSYNLAEVGSGPSSNGNYGPFSTTWGSTAITGLPPADFEAAGGGTVALNIDATSFPSDNPGVIEINDVFYDPEGAEGVEATAALQVTYTYAAISATVPEPSGLAVLVGAIASLAAVRLVLARQRRLFARQ